ncbi:MAG: glycosyltransferase family 2 protein [Pseudomonadota bacterium]
MKDKPELSVIIPVYNSEGTIASLVCAAELVLRDHFAGVQFVLVNDGSRDGSHEVILEMLSSELGYAVKYIQLARNFGEHNAVICGLRYADGDVAAIIDDDFQNPPEEIIRLVTRLRGGYDVVYSRYELKRHSLFRNLGSRFNDLVATALLKKPRGLYLSSFKVINRFVIDIVTSYEGPYPYLDGLILRSTRSIGTQLCEHQPRQKGESNYTLRKLVSLWLNMFTSFSVSPLRVASYLGLSMAAVGFFMALFFILSWSVGGVLSSEIPKGWASLIVTLTFFSGIQLLVLGLVGEYVGRVFMTLNRQPQSVVRSVIDGRIQNE